MRIVATDLTKRYGTGENQVIALHKANLENPSAGFYLHCRALRFRKEHAFTPHQRFGLSHRGCCGI